jgi:hypothetical protein
VSKIMKPRLVASSIMTRHAGGTTYSAECPFGDSSGHRFSHTIDKEW